MRREFFEILIDKYLAGTADAAERKMVEEYLDRMAARYSENLDKHRLEEATSGIYQRLAEQIRKEETPVVPMRRNWLQHVAVAAVILILIGSGVYYYINNTNVKNDIAVVYDPLPGRTTATLTLDDGRQIILDSAAKGLLAVEGGININSEEGAINYAENDFRHSGSAPGSLNTRVLYNTLTTRRGEQYRALKLSDGTKVWLNASSSIRFPVAFNGNERKVEVSGEVYFEVAKNPSKPFKVTLQRDSYPTLNEGVERNKSPELNSRRGGGGLEILVLGTSFNINSYPDESSIKTTLIDGSVKISANNKELKLSPGLQAELNQNNLILNKNIDTEEVIAWKEGLFQFESAGIRDVMRQLSRWYDIDVIIEPGVGDRKFFGSITRDVSLSGVLKILKASDINYKIEGKKLIVTK